ncbi:hypothetical protein P3T76_002252 [Phytophthora citrophthora]|uniref:Uncharacterized protein n=1 Tax=Phytophthora citrophthora TaxID=4793 RepID=A0AAD9LR43_9STRA|nr:hypothetical protein P3T76_002252 [Phytophthora citrophthora]
MENRSDNGDLVERVAYLVELNRRVKGGALPPEIKRGVLIKFWAKMREILFANNVSVGMQ